jgi:uncharacterized protein (DUF58 family)
VNRTAPDDRLLSSLRWPLRQAVFGKDPGGWRSRSGGDGLEIATVREYVSGDDVRRINWTASARTGQLQVVVPVAERALNSLIVLDASGSMSFGSVRTKHAVAVEAAETLNRIASRHSDRVQLIAINDRVHASGAHQGRAASMAASSLFENLNPCGDGGFSSLLRENSAIRNGLLIAVGDFRDPESRDGLRESSRRGPVVAVVVHDPHERSLPAVGSITLRDPEDGGSVTVDTGCARTRLSFATKAEELRRSILESAAGCVSVVEVCTDGPHGGFQVVQSLLAGRKSRR